MEMLAVSVVFTAGLLWGPRLAGTQVVTTSLEEQCYNVGSCTPLEEPTGDQQEICKVFEDALTCMQEGIEACKELDFPQDTVHLASNGIKLLRLELTRHCPGQLTHHPHPDRDDHLMDHPLLHNDDAAGADDDAAAEVVSDDENMESFNRDEEDRSRSEQLQTEYNAASHLPCPHSAMIVISLLLFSACVARL